MTTAKNYTKGSPNRKVRLIVIHSMESQEKPGTAIQVAKWFSNDNAPQASAHWCVDATSAVQVVSDDDIAWGAPGANADGLHIECAGKAAQTRAEWLDDYSMGVIRQAAKVAARWVIKYNIPIAKLTPEQVRDGKTKGICGHIDVTKAWPDKGSHTDPGAGFPWDVFLSEVTKAAHPSK